MAKTYVIVSETQQLEVLEVLPVDALHRIAHVVYRGNHRFYPQERVRGQWQTYNNPRASDDYGVDTSVFTHYLDSALYYFRVRWTVIPEEELWCSLPIPV
jgi:hypothetical protein